MICRLHFITKKERGEVFELFASTIISFLQYRELPEEGADFSIEYALSVSSKKLFGIVINVTDEIDDFSFSEIIDELPLLEEEEIIVVYHDDKLFSEYKELYIEIAQIESLIRELVSFVLYHNNKLEPDVLKNRVVNPQPSFKDRALNFFRENSLFHILFGDYIKLSQPKAIDIKEIATFLQSANDFGDLKAKIKERKLETIFAGFIASLTDKMDPLERVRNAIAHYRRLSEKEIENYKKAKEELFVLLNNFLSKIKLVDCACGGKLMIKEGQYGPFWGCENFPNCKESAKLNL